MDCVRCRRFSGARASLERGDAVDRARAFCYRRRAVEVKTSTGAARAWGAGGDDEFSTDAARTLRAQIIRANWVVFLLATVTLWGFVIGVTTSEANVRGAGQVSAVSTFFANATSAITHNFTWFYTLTQNAWLVVVFYVLLKKKYANVRLGTQDDAPEYSDLVWFILIFTTGLGTGIFYFGVSEPMYYYRDDAGALNTNSNYLAKIPFMNDDQRASMAMFLTFFHWGFHGWAPYLVVGLTTGVVCYRLGRPLTLRSAFYPLFGDYVNGLFGDIIDAMSIACTTFGLSTSLGLGANSINATIHRINGGIPNDNESVKSFIIWIITALTTGAVVSGLDRGMVPMAILAFSVLSALILLLFMLDNTWYIANIFTQTTGTYMQYFIQAGFDNDALPQLALEFQEKDPHLWGDPGIKGRVEIALGTTMADSQTYYESTPASFMNSWTVFYWAWWITWAPFVGLFIARISRGRTVREIILVGMFAPIITGFFALSVLGSLGIRMERIAELSLKYAPDWRKGVVNCAGLGYLNNEPASDAAIKLANDVGIYALACRKSTDRILDVLEPYGNLTKLLQVLVLIGVISFFVTSADAGAFADDMIAAGGIDNPPVLQRVWWSITQGATAQALLSSSKTGLSTISSVSICAALPYTFALNAMCVALFRALDEANGDPKYLSMRKNFSTSIIDVFDNFNGPDGSPDGKIMSTKERLVLLLKIILNPYHAMFISALELFTPFGISVFSFTCTTIYYIWILLLCLTPLNQGTHNPAWLMYLLFAILTTAIRYNLRAKWHIVGNFMDDFIACFFFYPFALAQMKLEVESHTGRAPPSRPRDWSVRGRIMNDTSVRSGRSDASIRGKRHSPSVAAANVAHFESKSNETGVTDVADMA